MARDPISSVKHFATSLKTDTGYTLRTTASGIAHSGSIEGPHKFTTPLLGAGGLLLVFGGVATGNPIHIGAGGISAVTAAARYFEHGEEIAAKAKSGGEPPAPPPPV